MLPFALPLFMPMLRRHLGALASMRAACCSLALMLGVAWTLPARAQVDVAPGFVHDAWDSADGLPVGTVNRIVQGSGGYLWLATFDGLVRFDGDRFAVFNTVNTPGLPSNRIDDLAEDRAGRLWFVASEQYVGFRDAGRYIVLPDSAVVGDRPHFFQRSADGTLWLRGRRSVWQIVGDSLRLVWRGEAAPEHLRTRVGPEGALWIVQGTEGFVRISERDTLHFGAERFGDVMEVFPDPERPGVAWITTARGSFRYDASSGAFARLADPLTSVRSFFRSTEGVLYVGALDALYRYDEASDRLVTQPIVREASGNERWSLHWNALEAPRGAQWIVGMQHVLSGERVALTLTMPQSFIKQALVDGEGNLWVATNRAGLHRLRPSLFATYGVDEGLPSENVYAVREDASGSMWIGTLGGGVVRLDTAGRIETWQRPRVPNIVFDALPLADGGIVVGGGGLSLARGTSAPRFEPTYEETLGISVTTPPTNALYEDAAAGCLWVGGQLGAYRSCGGELSHFTVADGLPSDIVRSFLPVGQGQLWISTNGGGLAVYQHGEFTTFGEAEGLPSGLTRGLYQDETGAIWVATEDRGLARIELPPSGDLAGARVAVFDTETGLFDNAIHAVVEDDFGRLWMSTNRGIFWVPRADLEAVARGEAERVFSVSYDERAGLRDREANGGTQSPATKASDGRLWFATQAGAVVIDPAAVQVDTARVQTHIEAVGGMALLADAKTVRLPLGERDVTVGYTGLHFTRPETLRFRYRLREGAPWTEAGGRREAIFTNLAPGSYTFEVIASAYPGQWPERGATLGLVIPAAFYEKAAFRIAALLLLGLGLVGVALWRERRSKQRERELERQVEAKTLDVREEQARTEAALVQVEEQAAKLEALDETKSRFFANISHEFRTPLTLTLGPLEDLGAGQFGVLPEGAGEQVRLAHRNAQRLLKLINQLLDLSRLEAGALTLQRSCVDLGALLRGIVDAFTLLADRKRITLTLDLPPTGAWVDGDADRLDEVFVNLIGNAFKFTPEGRRITVAVRGTDSAGGEAWATEVADTGVGIAPEDVPHVFERFYQGARGQSPSLPGTGVGLALSREIVELHGGSITAESVSTGSSAERGSRFTVTLPRAAEASLAASGAQGDGSAESGLIWRAPGAQVPAPTPEPKGTAEPDRTTVLVVDDHADIRAYVRRHLEPAYRVLEARDGREGVALARHSLPDLVVSDVMMPGLDGYELCRALKTGPATAFIPVVLLTGRAAAEDKLAGLSEGADDYLVKPFDVRELRARVDNLITQRHRLREALARERADSSSASAAAAEVPAPISADEAFVAEVEAAILAHLGDETFTVERLAGAVGLSRSQLGRRLKATTGATPTSTLRAVRLAEAARLIAAEVGTVSEIAYAVGFNSVAHFSRAFRAEFGVAPSEYAAAGA